MKKGFIIGLTTGVVLTGASLVLANSQIQAILNDQISLKINGEVKIMSDATTGQREYPITYKDRTYIPLRSVATLLGMEVDYDDVTKTAIINSKSNDEELNENKQITLKPSKYIYQTFKNENEASEFFIPELDSGDLSIFNNFYVENEIYTIGEPGVETSDSKYTASSTYKQSGTNFDANNLNNLWTDNCWCEGVNGNGIGETINVNTYIGSPLGIDYDMDIRRLEEKCSKEEIASYYTEIKQIAIINGFAKTDELWKNNNRVKKIKLTIEDKDEYILELDDNKNIQLFDINYKKHDITKKINMKFEILEVYNGEKFDDTCITSLGFLCDSNVEWRLW